MILINIDALSDSEIRYIAQQEDLNDWDTLPREDLIEELEDLYGEDIHEKENSAVKFVKTIVSTSSDVLDLPDVEPIPTSYSDTTINFIAVDFNWAYAFWNIAPVRRKELEDQNASLSIRVCSKDSSNSETYDISVSLNDSNWSIELPWEGKTYSLSLVANINGNEQVLCSSNTIYRDKPFISQNRDILKNEDMYKLLASSLISKNNTVLDCSSVKRILEDVKEDL